MSRPTLLAPAAAGLALLVVVVGAACALDRRAAELERILVDRASHLSAAQRREVVQGLVAAERRSGVDALLLIAVAEQESHFRRDARGPRGARGLIQVKPITARDVAQRHGIRLAGDEMLHDPSVNLLIGATYLRELEEQFGSWPVALTAYNRGPTKVRALLRQGKSADSRYSRRVMQRYRTLQKRAGS